jgi:hypothetical protein
MGTGPFDSLSATVSYSGQTDDRSSQSIKNSKKGLPSPIRREQNHTGVIGVQGQALTSAGARHRPAFGAELYAERVDSERADFSDNASTGGLTDAADVRARFPDNATYRTVAFYAHDGWTIVDNRLAATVGMCRSSFRYTQTRTATRFRRPAPVCWRTPRISATSRTAPGWSGPPLNTSRLDRRPPDQSSPASVCNHRAGSRPAN